MTLLVKNHSAVRVKILDLSYNRLERMNIIKKNLALLHPAYWLAWLVLGILWMITRLPNRWQMGIGRLFGNIVYKLSPKLRHITQVNIQLCYPDMPASERDTFIKKNFESLGIGIIETAMAWWIPDKKLKKFSSVTLHGEENAVKAFAKGKGIILLSPHFTCLEMIGRSISSQYSVAAMYRPHKNKLLNLLQERFRQRYQIKQIARHRMREVLKSFNDNMALWYAYDIDAGEKRSVFAPFFGISTASLTMVSRIASLTGAAVVPIAFHRKAHSWDYEIHLQPALENFPSDDYADDAARLNQQIENSIRKNPEQYIWQYKRFKTRPEGEKRFY
jgi:KDO2-lipid IV(A) lauroyltransferase